jgi:hypothetical protein
MATNLSDFILRSFDEVDAQSSSWRQDRGAGPYSCSSDRVQAKTAGKLSAKSARTTLLGFFARSAKYA